VKDPHTIIVSPHITEKATERLDDHGVYVFKVARDANKIEIKAAVEDIFDVKVKNVNVSNQRGRRKRIGRLRRLHHRLQEGRRHPEPGPQDRRPLRTPGVLRDAGLAGDERSGSRQGLSPGNPGGSEPRKTWESASTSR